MSFAPEERRFLNSSSTSVIVPHSTNFNFAEALQDEEGETTLQNIKQRDSLFFDERLIAYVVLHVPQCTEEELRLYRSRLDFRLEVWATSGKQTLERSPGTANLPRDLIFSDTVNHSEDPILLISQDEDDESIYLNLVWEVPVVLNRPRTRLQDTHILFSPKAFIAPFEEPQPTEVYLEPFKPQAGNLFEPLKGSRGYEGELPYLPLSRLESVLPLPPKDDHTFHVRSIVSEPMTAHLAFVTRLRYSRPTFSDIIPSLIASLDIDVIPFVQTHGTISVAELTLRKGKVIPFMGHMLPMICQSKDCVTFLYRLEQSSHETTNLFYESTTQVGAVDIRIRLDLQLSEDCCPVVEMRWTTNVDFGQTINNTSTAVGSAQKPGGTPNSSIDSKVQDLQYTSTSLQPITQRAGLRAVTISFTSSTAPAKVGVPFSWQVLIVNRSTKPAKIAIIPLPRIQKSVSQAQQYAKRHATRSSLASLYTSEKNGSEKVQGDVAQAVIDENIIYAMQRSGAVPPETDLVSLTPELRVGPLGPGQCHEGEIRLIAFKAGAFMLDAIRVVDLIKEAEQGHSSPGVVTDIRELPDVIVEDAVG